MRIITNQTNDNITMHFICDNDVSLSWEQIQEHKDKFFPNKLFVECYPEKTQIVNKANERHIIHIKGLHISFSDVTELNGMVKEYKIK